MIRRISVLFILTNTYLYASVDAYQLIRLIEEPHINVMNAFDQKKQLILREIGANSEDLPDASPKGTIDVLCLPIIDTINAHPDMVTTSLCLGRVSVFLEGIKQKAQIGAKGNEGRWLFVTHEPKDLDNWHNSVDFCYKTTPELHEDTRYILYKFEPLILHVKCRDGKTANLLYSTAMGCGFRESGISSNNIVAIRILIKLDVPIGYLDSDSDNKLVSIVPVEYLKTITKLSHDRFAENMRKMAQLHENVARMGIVQEEKVLETKEQRRERKIREGMERRAGVREEKDRKKLEKLEKLEHEKEHTTEQRTASTSKQ